MSPLLPGIIASGISGHLFTPEGSAYEIASYTVPSGGVASVSLAVPSGYRHLQLMISNISAGWTTMRFNNVSSSGSYSGHEIRGEGSGSPFAQSLIGYDTSFMWINLPYDANQPTMSIVDIPDYQSTAKNKTVRALSGTDANGGGNVQIISNAFYSTNPITSMQFQIYGGGNFGANSQFTLIGYK